LATDVESEIQSVARDAEAWIRIPGEYDERPTFRPVTIKESPPVDANEWDTIEETDAPM